MTHWFTGAVYLRSLRADLVPSPGRMPVQAPKGSRSLPDSREPRIL